MSLFGFGGRCEICGCTEDNPCYNPEHGFCGWADDEHTVCTHCAIKEIAEDPETIHRVNDLRKEETNENKTDNNN